MEKRIRLLIVSLLVAQVLMLAVAPVSAGGDAPAGAYEPESITLDGEAMHEVAALGERMQGYLRLDKNGTLSLAAVDPSALGVGSQYLQSYKAALEYVNSAVEQGLFSVDEDFHVSWPEDSQAVAAMPDPEEAQPDWGYYRSQPGLYVYFNPHDVRYYLPDHGLSTALSLASYIHKSWIVVPYTYHFTYHRIYRYYYYHTYSCCGVWSFVYWHHLPYYTGYYQPTYRVVYYWYPYSRYWYYYRCYW